MKKGYVELWIGQTLRWGVILVTAVMLIGGAFYLLRHGSESAGSGILAWNGTDLQTIPAVWEGATRGDTSAVLQCGVLFLLFLPIMRVWLCLITFVLTKDLIYTVISLWLLIVLLGSFFLN